MRVRASGGRWSRRRVAVVSLGLAVAMASSALPAPAAPDSRGWHGLGWDLPGLPPVKSVPGTVGTSRPLVESESQRKVLHRPAAVAWPKPMSTEIDLPAKADAPKGVALRGAPVTVAHAAGKPGAAVAGRVKIDLLDRKFADRAGVAGVMFRVTPVSGDLGGRLAVDFDYSALASAYGADYGRRLTFVSYPECVLTTPSKPACRQRTPVPSVNSGGSRLAGDVTLRSVKPREGAAPARSVAAPTVLAAVAESSGGEGDFTATSLSPAGSWTAGGSSGGFSYDYPITLPAPPAGEAPGVALKYSSGTVDGATSATNNQASWVGDGWNLSVGGYIERSYKNCARDLGGNNGQTKTGDQCWATDNATLSLGAASGPLVKNEQDGVWRPKNDDGSRVERLTGAANGARDGEYWKVTTSDGTQYFFGQNRLPGWTSGKPETKSTFTVPVFGNNSGEPCHQTTFAASWCQQAYRWNLDYVIDPQGNQLAYYYQPEINYYGLNRNWTTAGTSYIRGGYLLRMEYGLNTKAGGAYAQPPARVVFDTAERCLPSGSITCDPAQLNAANAASWPDVPADQICEQGDACPSIAPTFFSRKRLTAITTQVTNGSGGWDNRDKWTLAHSFPATGSGQSPALWFASVVRTGLAGGSLALPPTTFGGTAKANRTFASQNYTSLVRYRLTSVTNELGGSLTVDYSAPDCQSGAPNPATNTTRCFPSFWTPGGQENPILDWFNKYVVTDVYADGRTPLSVQTRTHYDYVGGGAWHFDENHLVDEQYRTWSQWHGYGEVTTTSGNPGDPAGPRTVVTDRYMRGMHGDKAATGTKTVSVTNALGESIPDAKQYQGFKRETTSYLDGNAISNVINDPWSSETATDVRGLQAFMVAVGATRTRDWIAATGTWRTTRTATTYTDQGLPETVQQDGDVTDATQTSCTRTRYVPGTTAWMFAYPSEIEKVAGPCADNPATSSNVLSLVRHRYDGQAFGVHPTAGRLTQVDTLDTWPSGGAPTFVAVKKSTYDSVYGRETSVTDALARTTTTSYTPTTGGPVTQVSTSSPQVTIAGVATSLTTSETYDPVSGLPTSKVDQSGLRTDFTYDPVGRLTAAWAPGRSKSAGLSATMTFGYAINTNAPNVVTTGTLLRSGQYGNTFTIIDGLGRTVQMQEPSPHESGGRIVADTQYDSQGRVWKVHNPYWNSAAPSGALLVVQDNAVPGTTVTTFDSANRPVASSSLLYGTEQWRTSTVYDGDRVTTIPPDGGTARAVVANGLGQKIRTLQFKDRTKTGPTDPADATTYAYTRAGQLASVTDSTGENTWTFTYDLRGRKISQTDPDAGSSSSTYDAADQLLTTTDARGKKLAYTYDKLGRKTASFDTSTSGTRLAVWTYDSLLKGRPTSAVRFVGGKAYVRAVSGYDAAGRPTGSKVTVPSGEGSLSGTYEFTTAYDPNTGAVDKESSPGIGGLPAETVFRDYDTLGNPTESFAANGGGGAGTKLVSKTEYSPIGQVLRMNYAAANDPKQVSTTWTYEDGTGRLSAMSAVRASETDPWITNRSYTYADSGALTRIADNPTGGTPDTQCFTYDYLQRLSKAWTPASGDCAQAPTTAGLGGAAPYWKEWTYDLSGNRLSQTQRTAAGDKVTTLQYPAAGSPRPHAVSAATTTTSTGTSIDTFTYDAGGNTLTSGKPGSIRTFTYDIEGRVATATDSAGGSSSYLYDADGTRLITRDPTGTTLHVGDTELFVAAGTTTATGTRFYTHAGQQVAVRTTAGLTWKIADHHGTATASVNAATLAVSHRKQDPFGNVRGSAPSSWPDRRGFIGMFEDKTGLVHIGAREYDPTIGRFTSVDPILDLRDPQSWNGYAYANNNPIDYSDPTGLWCDGCEQTDIGVNCPPCGGGTPPSSPAADPSAPCDSCGWSPLGGSLPAKVGSEGKPILDLSRMAKPPLMRDLTRYFQRNGYDEWVPRPNNDNILEPIPGYVPPEELSTGQKVLVTVGVFGALACVLSTLCVGIVAGAVEAVGPPVAFGATVTAGVGTAKVINVVDDALKAGDNVPVSAAGQLPGIAAKYRANTANGVGKDRNVAVARYDINGVAGEAIAVSGKHRNPGTVGIPANPTFNPGSRTSDSEWQILESIAPQLNSGSRGTINLYTERAPCASCQSVISQFRDRFPGVEINVSHG